MQKARDPTSSTMTSLCGQGKLGRLTTELVQIKSFPRTFVATRYLSLFPPLSRCLAVTPGSNEMSPPHVSHHSTGRAPEATIRCARARHDSTISSYRHLVPRADNRGSDKSSSQRRASAGCEDAEKAWRTHSGLPHPSPRIKNLAPTPEPEGGEGLKKSKPFQS